MSLNAPKRLRGEGAGKPELSWLFGGCQSKIEGSDLLYCFCPDLLGFRVLKKLCVPNFTPAPNQASLRDAAVLRMLSRHCVSGYYREVPPGQEACRLIAAAAKLALYLEFEDIACVGVGHELVEKRICRSNRRVNQKHQLHFSRQIEGDGLLLVTRSI
jgi:hypothetical protein